MEWVGERRGGGWRERWKAVVGGLAHGDPVGRPRGGDVGRSTPENRRFSGVERPTSVVHSRQSEHFATPPPRSRRSWPRAGSQTLRFAPAVTQDHDRDRWRKGW